MAAPIQNFISITAAASSPTILANNAQRAATTNQFQNSAVQQIIATQAAKVVTNPGEKRVTDDRQIVDPSFDSEEKSAKEDETETEQPTISKRKHSGALDVVA